MGLKLGVLGALLVFMFSDTVPHVVSVPDGITQVFVVPRLDEIARRAGRAEEKQQQ